MQLRSNKNIKIIVTPIKEILQNTQKSKEKPVETVQFCDDTKT